MVYTYILSGASGLDNRQFRKLLNDNGFVEVDLASKPSYVDFIFLEQNRGGYNKDTYGIRNKVRNLLENSKSIVSDKEILYSAFVKYYPELAKNYMAETWHMKELNALPKDKVIIMKPVGRNACSGKDVFVIDTPEYFQQVKIYLNKYESAIASEYIANPLLFHGRKFHLRVYLMVRTHPTYEYYIFPRARIMTAKAPYKNSDYKNKDIHDTHLASTEKDYWFPQDLAAIYSREYTDYIEQQINVVGTAVGEILRLVAKPYEESQAAFEIFGMDILVNDKLVIKLLEVNEKVGFGSCDITPDFDREKGPWTPEFSEFSSQLFQWIFEKSLNPLFDNIKYPIYKESWPEKPKLLSYFCN